MSITGFSATEGDYEIKRLVGPITGIFFLLAGIPTFLLMKERAKPKTLPPGATLATIGFKRLGETLSEVRQFRDLIVFLLSYFFAYSGLAIVISFAFIYGEQEIKWSGGAAAIMIENFGDVPFAAGRVDALTIASMTRATDAIRREVTLPLGVNVLRNDGFAALSIARAVGARFVRVNVLSGARLTDQGLVQSEAYELMRLRERIGAADIAVLADVAVKHSAPIAPMALVDEVHDLVDRALADAVVVSGSGTGSPVSRDVLVEVAGASSVPVVIGSGLSLANAPELAGHFDAAIVGSSIKQSDLTSPVDPNKVAALARALGITLS